MFVDSGPGPGPWECLSYKSNCHVNSFLFNLLLFYTTMTPHQLPCNSGGGKSGYFYCVFSKHPLTFTFCHFIPINAIDMLSTTLHALNFQH